MTPERWQQITNIFQVALERNASGRVAYLNEACAGDDDLRREVDAMLASHDQASKFIEEPAMNVAARPSGDGRTLVGQTIAHYQVLSLLGSSGMGDVYLALDTKLGRQVALKLLPEYLAGDTHRARLFTKEARAASALNHPNIITTHEIGQLGDRYYIAMEYVEGETLRSHIYEQKTPLTKLLKYLQQVAEGLTKAHANGIVHRDLKPDNIMITRDGYAKILDFGLAKLLARQTEPNLGEASEVATALMSPASVPGMVMGTVGYMSPEQAQGKTREIDHRSDIFSFGCILFEAAAGRKAFEGSDLIDSLHKIVHAPTPSLRDMNPNAPPELDRIIRRCLQKDHEKRYQSIKDVALELEELQQELKSLPSDQSRPVASQALPTAEATAETTSSAEYLVSQLRQHKRGLAMTLMVAIVVLGGIAFWFYKSFWKRWSAPAPEMRIIRLTNSGNASNAAVSPDAKFVAYVVTEAGMQSVRLCLVDNPMSSTVLVPPTKKIGQGITGLTFSQDGKSLYYNAPSYESSFSFDTAYGIYQVPILGGTTKKLADKLPATSLLSPDGQRVAFARRTSRTTTELCISDVGGANERVLATRTLPQFLVPAAWSADGQMLALISTVGDGNTTGHIVVLTLADGLEKPLITSGNWFFRRNMKWLPDGSGLIFNARQRQSGLDQLWHVSFPGGELRQIRNDLTSYLGVSLSANADAMITTQLDEPLNIWLLPEGDSSRAKPITSGKHFIGSLSWTTDNRIVYMSGEVVAMDISMLAADGTGQKILAAGSESANYVGASVSPDGRSITFISRGRVGIMDLDGGNHRFVTTPPPLAQGPQMTPDSQWVIYSSNEARDSRLYKVSINGGEPVQILDKPIWRALVSPDGNLIACLYRETGDEPYKIAILPFAGGPPLKIFDITSGPQRLLRWANDGRGLYYTDERDGVTNIWRQPVDAAGPPNQVTNFTEGVIRSFAWSREGKWLAVSRGVPTSDVVLISGFD
jgi:eukaryotic-like serine/threonine-protein kinase